MSVKVLIEQHLEFLSYKGGCTGLSESTLVKMSHCWKSHVVAQMKLMKCLYVYKSPRGVLDIIRKVESIVLLPCDDTLNKLGSIHVNPPPPPPPPPPPQLPLGWGCCPFLGCDSILFAAIMCVFLCVWSIWLKNKVLCVLSKLAIISLRKRERARCFTLIVFLPLSVCMCVYVCLF